MGSQSYVRGSATWIREGSWEMKSKGKLSTLTDANRLYDAEFELTRLLFADTDFRAGYNFETEHMRDISRIITALSI